MPEYDNTNRGGLWVNKKKVKDNHPDYTGNIDVNGAEFWISAWKKYSSKTGEAFLSISIKEKDDVPKKSPSGGDDFLVAGGKPAPDVSYDDDIPF